MNLLEVEDLPCNELRKYLAELVESLDMLELEPDEPFGPEGWRTKLMGD